MSARIERENTPANIATVARAVQRKLFSLVEPCNIYAWPEASVARRDEAIALDALRILPRCSMEEFEMLHVVRV